MTDVLFIPDAFRTEFMPARQLRLVDPGLSPIVDEASERPTRTYPPCYAPCPSCGHRVLTGETTAGRLVVLDVQIPMYAAVWLPNTSRPVLHELRGYPEHRCAPGPHVCNQHGGGV